MRVSIASAGFLLAAQGALACGYCVEDKVAAAYDHSVVVRALDRRHEVVFLAIEGPLPESREMQLDLERAIESTPGVERGSWRVSLAGASLSFAYDPARPGLGPILRTLDRKLVAKHLGLSLLRIVNEGSGMTASSAASRAGR